MNKLKVSTRLSLGKSVAHWICAEVAEIGVKYGPFVI